MVPKILRELYALDTHTTDSIIKSGQKDTEVSMLLVKVCSITVEPTAESP